MTISLIELPEDLREWAEEWVGDEELLDLPPEELERRMKKVAKILVRPLPDEDPQLN